MTGCRRQCDWDDNMVCRSCGIDYSPPQKRSKRFSTVPIQVQSLCWRFRWAQPPHFVEQGSESHGVIDVNQGHEVGLTGDFVDDFNTFPASDFGSEGTDF